MSKSDYEEIAKIAYETLFDDKWKGLSNNSIEKAAWINVGKAIIKLGYRKMGIGRTSIMCPVNKIPCSVEIGVYEVGEKK